MDSFNLNRILLVGRVIRAPELQQVNGKDLVVFQLATDQEWETPGGGFKRKTNLHRIHCWGKLVEYAQRLVKPDRCLQVEGSQENFFSNSGGFQSYVSASFIRDLGPLQEVQHERTSDQEAAGNGS